MNFLEDHLQWYLSSVVHSFMNLYMRYRSKIEIISQILSVANGGGVTRTGIMYKAFLSFFQAKQFLTTLAERDLLHYDEETQTFKTTEKGFRVLQAYSELSEFTKGIEPNRGIRYIKSQAY